MRILDRFAERVWVFHAGYNLPTGVLPLISLRTFEAISGPKTDGWLVKTVGALVAVVGGALFSAGRRDRITPEVAGIAIGSSASLAIVDVVYVSRGRISRVYLLDALAEALLILGWVRRWQRSQLTSG